MIEEWLGFDEKYVLKGPNPGPYQGNAFALNYTAALVSFIGGSHFVSK